MRVFGRGRQKGKTTDLVRLMHLFPQDVMVVHNYREAHRLKEDYPDIADRIYAIESVQSGKLRGKRIDRIHVDNLDLILPYLLGGRIGIVMMTEEEGNE